MECRINAEDPFRGFLPSTGRLIHFATPANNEGEVRVDTGVIEGGEISAHYDSMIAKLITHGKDRNEAIARMRAALDSFVIRGIASNIPFQAALMQHPRFVSGKFTTAFIAEEFPQGFRAEDAVPRNPQLFAEMAALVHHRRTVRKGATQADYIVVMDGTHHAVRLTEAISAQTSWVPGQSVLTTTVDGSQLRMQVDVVGLRYRLFHAGTQVDALVLWPRAAELLKLMPYKAPPDLSRFLLAPMPGLLTEVAVKAGQQVKAGDKLAVIEAMKMENVLKAAQDGEIEEQLAKTGDSLSVDQPILSFRKAT
jgi:propionyl-CoA carboxylase alpha chain